MKQTILAVIVGAMSFGSYAAESESDINNKMSIGIDYLSSSNTFKAELMGESITEDIDSSAFGLNLGFKKSNNGQWFIAYQNESFDLGIYDDTNESLHYFSVGYNKEFPFESGLAPYIKGSIGVGTMSISGYSESSANAVGGKIGAGLGYYVSKEFKLTLGLDAQYRTWTPIQTYLGDMEISDTAFVANIGASYYF